MLHDFIVSHRDQILTRARGEITRRAWPEVSARELENGVPAVHGGELRALGFTVSQVVHDYGDICQAITAIALEQQAAMSVDEFHTLNRCLDTAIAEAVTEHVRVTASHRDAEELERLGQISHEVRDFVNTALMAYTALKRGNLGINGSTGAVLGRSLVRLSAFKFSIAGGSVSLSARRDGERLVIAVRDSCGGIPAQRGDPFEPFGAAREGPVRPGPRAVDCPQSRQAARWRHSRAEHAGNRLYVQR